METLLVWLALVVPSMLWGIFCGLKLKSKHAGFFSGAVPWFALLAYILYSEYFVPYKGGGASMWPIAQLFGGTVAAVVGYLSYVFFHNRLARNNSSQNG